MDPQVKNLIEGMLHKDPNQRFTIDMIKVNFGILKTILETSMDNKEWTIYDER